MAAFIVLTAGSAAFSLVAPQLSRRFCACSTRALRRAARHWLVVLSAPLLLFGALTITWAHGFPLPHIHDEFSYLLAADTFAHGRLSNPPHPLWPSFETFHVNQQPTYVSMYPPGWGLVLAAGQVLLGHPWPAVWITSLLMVIAIFWAAAGWLPRQWAIGAALAAAALVSGGYWLTSYWGGSLPALAGALIVGSAPRIFRAKHGSSVTVAAVAFGAGTAMLLATRPLVGLPLAAVLAATVLAYPTARRFAVWAPILLMTGLACCGLAYYNWRCTGDPLKTAYWLNLETYHQRPIFIFQSDRTPPVYRHEVMRRLYSEEYRRVAFSGTDITERKIPVFSFFGAHLLVFVLLASPWLFRQRRIRPVMWSTAAACAAALLTVWTRPHYVAPAAAGLLILAMHALRLTGTISWRGIGVGRTVAYAALLGWLILRPAIGVARLGEDASPLPWVKQRASIAQSLQQAGGRHLIFVKYDDQHDPNDEWVYNKADLGAAAPVIWARSMDEESNHALQYYYRDRTAWLVDFGAGEQPHLRRLVALAVCNSFPTDAWCASSDVSSAGIGPAGTWACCF